MGDISEWIQRALLLAIPFLLAVTVHELAHGYAAYRLGDPTAKMEGRLTFNPIKHLDPMGTLALLITQMIGWAKPVPINPFNFAKPREGMIIVSLAGPAANMAAAVIFSLIYHALGGMQVPVGQPLLAETLGIVYTVVYLTVAINIGLGIFNLIPIPPLDGSHILQGLLPRELALGYEKLKPYGFFILIGLIFLGVLDHVLYPLIRAVRGILL